MGKRVINNNEKCWCVNGSGCKDPTLGGVFKHNKEKYESMKEDRKFKEMNRESKKEENLFMNILQEKTNKN